MKHAFSDDNRGIRDQQAAILTAIESQTKAVISTMSAVQTSVTGMDEEVRGLRKDLETLRGTCAKSRVTYTLNSLPTEGEDTEYGVGQFEVGKTGPPSGDRAEALGNTQIHFHATNTNCDADVAGLADSTARIKDSTVKSHGVRLCVSPSPSSKDPDDGNQLDGPGPAQCPVQFSDHISTYIGTSSAPLGLENGNGDLDSSEVNVCIASMAMTPTSERQKDRHIYTPDDDAEMSVRPLAERHRSGKAIDEEISAAPAEEDYGTQNLSSKGNHGVFLECPSNSNSHTTSGRGKNMVVSAKDSEDNGSDDSDEMSIICTQSQGLVQDDKSIYGEDYHASCKTSHDTAAENEALIHDGETKSRVLPDSKAAQEVRRDEHTGEEGPMTRARNLGSREYPDADSSEVIMKEESRETLKPSEANEIDPKQSTDESRTWNDIDSHETVDCVVHNLYRTPSRGNDHSHPSDDVAPGIIQDSSRVPDRANRPWQVHHSTSTWTEDQKFDLDMVSDTALSELRNIDSELTEEVWADGLDEELARSVSVTTTPHYLLSSARDTATVDMDTCVSSSLDRLNSDKQRSPKSGSDSDMSLSTRCTDENSGVVRRSMRGVSSDQSASSPCEERRGQKRSREMSDEGYKNKHPKLQDIIEIEFLTGSPDWKGGNKSAAVLPDSFSSAARNSIPKSFQNDKTPEGETSSATGEQEAIYVEAEDRENSPGDVEDQDKLMQPTILFDGTTLDDEKSRESSCKPNSIRQGVTALLAQTSILIKGQVSTAEDILYQGTTRHEVPSFRQPTSSSYVEARRQKRLRETSNDGNNYTNKRFKSTSHLETHCEGDTASGDVRRRKVMGSIDNEMTDSSILNQYQRPQGDHYPEKLFERDETTLVNTEGGWTALVAKRKREREETMRRTQNVRNSLRPSRRGRGAENTIISGGISFIRPGSNSLRFQSGATSESARLFTAVGMEVDDASNTNE